MAVCEFKHTIQKHKMSGSSEFNTLKYMILISGMSDLIQRVFQASAVDLKHHHIHIFFLLLLLFPVSSSGKVIYVFLGYKLCSSTIIIPGSLMSQAFV